MAKSKKLKMAAAALGTLSGVAFTASGAQAATASTAPGVVAHQQGKLPASQPVAAGEWASLRNHGIHPDASYITWENNTYKKYLGIAKEGTDNGNWANVFSWFNGPNQKWYNVDLGYTEGGYTVWAFVNYNSDLCLADHYNEKSPGGHVDQWSCGYDSYPQDERWIEESSAEGRGWYLRNLGVASWPLACASRGDYVVWSHGFGSDCLWH
jgi:hypothetical protein